MPCKNKPNRLVVSGKSQKEVLENFQLIPLPQTTRSEDESRYQPSKTIFNDPDRNALPYSGGK